ncbi:MAG: NAD(P)/FAD-dependent oxidoreductase [Polaromonas sp.]|uniref:flavin-containing monooxygenase n=1 Tax=Polaromonas sp. TaxID=1869339 RepID=UPI0024880366|nr:NAD(P)/FAD-dependent oxidoreductase [Polaromonas sp.]MDI1238056.1 NAD(P)/FAD-dependent oxidoreductase [Polaromonas sp.]
MTAEPIDPAFFDVVVVGAGISGIAAAHYLQTLCPTRSYVILENRQALGGTWDLFRYPGVRSDSDMFTLGYSFRPWESDASFAMGPAIRDYVAATAREEGMDRHIRFGHRVTGAAWDSQQARWHVTATLTSPGEPARELRFVCRFLFFCSGYYNYEQGHTPAWPGREAFRGRIVHPQHWPADLDYRHRKVVVIGSGATAVTLVPDMAATAAHVTMLQRSPSYIVALPSRDGIGALLRRWLPSRLSHPLIRWKNIALASAFYQFSRRQPATVRRLILRQAARLLGPGFDVQRHLSPRYNPWDQRLCIAPDADIFRAVREGKADIVTGQIECFTPAGLRLTTGEEIEADVIVTATGLELKVLGGATLTVDGAAVDLAQCVAYRGAMFSGVPNLAVAFGYTNASWTLKCELVARYVCRLLNEMERRQLDKCVPVNNDARLPTQAFLDLSSGYVQRSSHLLARQGLRRPWRMYQNYLLDLLALKFSPLRDGVLRFSVRPAPRDPRG